MSNYETKVISLPINANLQVEVEKLSAEGWQQLPGAEPIAIYYLMRAKMVPLVASVEGKMIIDESKVFIRDKDGNVRSH